MSGLTPQVAAFKEKYNLGSDALWSAHGTWCIKHRDTQAIVLQESLQITLELIAADQEKGTAIFHARCKRDGMVFEDWGECSPANNKNAYPVSMALKRAYDRVALQALGIHGYIHSAEEMDGARRGERLPKKDARDIQEKMDKWIRDAKTVAVMRDGERYFLERCSVLPEDWEAVAKARFYERLVELQQLGSDDEPRQTPISAHLKETAT
jgi:hypothetical protein